MARHVRSAQRGGRARKRCLRVMFAAPHLTETSMRNWPLSITAVVFAISLGSAFAEDEAPVPDPNEPTAAAPADPAEAAAADTADTSSASTDNPATDSDGK